jgi:hypothetical protein
MSEKLAKYIYGEIQNLTWRNRGELFQKLTPSALSLWIEQFNLSDSDGQKKLHKKWGSDGHGNIWIEKHDESGG